MSLVSVAGSQAGNLAPACEVCEAASGVHRDTVENTCKSEREHRFPDSE